jgi:23S rRNA pseudouridine1911/1915/1917 synthase
MKKSSELCSILFDDPNVLIVNKDKGVAVQSKNKEEALENILSAELNIDLHTITRIDQPVSGIVIFAKTKEAAADLSGQLIRNRMQKTYYAIVEGLIEHDGFLEHKLSKGKNKKAIEDDSGQNARLTYRVVKKLDKYTIISIRISTGRFHQIRAQLAINGNAVKGDLKYGAKRSNEGGGIYLHCKQLNCFHPISGKKISVEASFPAMKLWQFAE